MGLLNPTGSSWESSCQRTEVTGTGQEASVRAPEGSTEVRGAECGRGGTVTTHPCPQLPSVLRVHGTKRETKSEAGKG